MCGVGEGEREEDLSMDTRWTRFLDVLQEKDYFQVGCVLGSCPLL